jgi:hypothetical protein
MPHRVTQEKCSFLKKRTKKLLLLWSRFAVPAGVCGAIILLAGWVAGYVPARWRGVWADHVVATQAHFVDRFFPFDAVWYQRIADHGYVWDAAQPGLKQDVAFFPLWPLLLRAVSACAAPRWTTVGLAACFALASIWAFQMLARRVLPRDAARTATWLFALYPGASFLLLSYPAGLMNLLCCLAVLAVMDGQFLAAALASGLVTAAGPLGLGTALMVCSCASLKLLRELRQEGARARPIAVSLVRTLGLCVVSVAGLAGFLVWQYVAVGDAFAFMKAQEAWQVSPPWPQRMARALGQVFIVPDFLQSLRALGHTARGGTLVAVQADLQRSLYLAAEGLELIALVACTRLRCRPLLLQSVFTMALFIWFHGTVRPGKATLRLTYCAIGIFCGAAWLLRDRPRATLCVLGLSAALLAGGAFLVAMGYGVV